MPISDVASLVGGAALGAPLSEIFKLVIEEAKKVKDFKPLSQDLASTMERLVPIFNEIDMMQQGSNRGTSELKVLTETMERAGEMVHKCSRIQWYSIAKKALYTREIKAINQDFLKFCQIELQLIQHRNQLQYMRSMGMASRPLMELKKMLFEDGVVTVVVSAPYALGKTTLVTKLCHDADVKEKFKQIFFISVSKFPNVRLIGHKLLEHIGCKANEYENDLDAMLYIQQLLKQLGRNGSILLVLDDVWAEEESLLQKFLIQLPDYKILVTSRFEFTSFGPTFHLKPLIDDEVECRDEIEENEKLPEVNPPLSMCGGCNSAVKHEESVNILGVLWHPGCFCCRSCDKPIAIHELENHVSNSRGKFHKSCYERYCYVCKEKKMKTYNNHPFWEERYCPVHEADGTPKCCSCERLEPRGTKYGKLSDGRWLCLECGKSAMDSDECQPLYFDMRDFFESLNMKIEKEFPLILVGKELLNKKEEKIDNHYEELIRAYCMSEQKIMTYVSEEPRTGQNKQLIDMDTEPQGVVHECKVTAILILYGLPRLLTGYILAHEMMHAYLRLNGHRNLNNILEEGICQVLGHLWLESQTYATADTTADAASASSSSSRTPPAASASKKGEWSDFDKKLVEFCKNQIETDESPVYGLGFRTVNEMVTNSSLQETLKEILRRR
ncbi:unnamed protein product [Arabidopsis thaliana]|uniref:Uncharacterized protein n=1 Tax=Arabidopsis thaliana TaxID=3702 RepID=A0A654GEP3_ARATH|nr:unnamed protein product [Arabidopsis thaliana]